MTHLPDILHYAVSVVGKDRPGIVAGISEVLFRLGCNIADSSCTMLAGEFAMILIVSHSRPFGKGHLFDELKPACDALGMSLAVRTLHPDEVTRREAEGEICMVSVYVMMLEAALPEGQTPETLAALLDNLKKELNVEIGVRVITPVAL